MIALSYSVSAVRQSVVIVYIVGGMRAWHSNAFVHQIKFAAANFAENVAAADDVAILSRKLNRLLRARASSLSP